jgi:hypothetical protein
MVLTVGGLEADKCKRQALALETLRAQSRASHRLVHTLRRIRG